jgi:hypothetical protein
MTRVLAALGSVFVVIAVSGHAQTPARDAGAIPPPPAGTGAIAGIVKDHDGNPVRRGSVRINGDANFTRSTVTDDEGRFSFAGLPAGRFRVTAVKPGFPEFSYGASRPFRAGSGVFLQDGQQVRDLALTLARGGAITGTVYDERGEPMPGVPVMAWEYRTALNGDRTLEFSSGFETVNTDDRGVYRVYGLPPGEYTIGTSWSYHGMPYDVRVPTDAEIRAAFQSAAQPAPSSPGAAGPAAPVPARYNYAPVFAPGVTDPMTAATIKVGAGDEHRGVDLRMQFQPMSRIEGTIVTPDGNPVEGTLMISRRSSVQALNVSSVMPSMSELRFTSSSLSPGDYVVTMDVPRRGDRAGLFGSAHVVIGGGGEPATASLVLQPTRVITGRIVFEGSTPRPANLSKVVVSLRGGAAMPTTATTIDDSGALTISGVMPAQYTLSTTVPGAQPAAGWRLRSVTVGGRDVTDRRFDLAGVETDLTVTFTDQVSELTGRITSPSGAAATDFFVIALPADRAYWTTPSRRIVSARPDRTGQYIFRGLPAGEYRIAVTTDLIPRDLQDAAALERLAAQSVPVTLATGEKKTLDVRTAAGGGDRRP